LRASAPKRAYMRVESSPGERFEIDWGHFGSLHYQGDKRKLYAFSLIECHSRKMYVEFTHSQCFETFARCHVHAFQTLGGIARELAYDNLSTAVVEHDGNLVRYNPRFLGFVFGAWPVHAWPYRALARNAFDRIDLPMSPLVTELLHGRLMEPRVHARRGHLQFPATRMIES